MARIAVRGFVLGLVCLLLAPCAALAQSQFTGQVKDESGGALPGVTVEAASPVLIEKAKSVVTDSSGRYTIVDLRPGAYKLTFSLTGFGTVVRDNVDLPSNFVANVNIEMKVGALEETITVSGQSPLVDTQQAAKTQVLSRDLLDALPLVRQFTNSGVPVPGIRTGVPDVGGNRMVVQNKMQSRGAGNADNDILYDGQRITGMLDQGSTVPYSNEGMSQEVTVTLVEGSAEAARSGVIINSIPRDGGNVASGAVWLSGSKGSWQSNNADPSKLKNVVSPPGAGHIRNFNGSLGGPIRKNKAWFFLSVRHVDSTRINVNSLNLLGQRAYVEDQYIRNVTPRITYQVADKHKFAVSWDRTWKQFGHDQGGAGVDETATQTRSPRHGPYGTGAAKWTSTLSSRWLYELGFHSSESTYVATAQPWRIFQRGSPEWYAAARKETDPAGTLVSAPDCYLLAGCSAWNSNQESSRLGLRQGIATSISFVTGSHNVKFGVQHDWGPEREGQNTTADLTQVYRIVNGVRTPYQVRIENTPRQFNAYLDYESAVFIQDSWTIKRLTVSPGLRVEWFKGENLENFADPGRFVPARLFPGLVQPFNWDHLPAPRVAVAYDLFGDGKTAIKGSIGKFYQTQGVEMLRPYTAARSAATSTFNWVDNGDDIAQDNEFLPNGCVTCGSNATFGTLIVSQAADPSLKHAYNWKQSIQIQREMFNRLSLSFGAFRTPWHDLGDQRNLLVPRSAWLNSGGGTEFTVTNPLNRSQVFKAYQLAPASRGQSQLFDTTNPDFRQYYNGIELSGQARLPRGAILFGGWTMERMRSVSCNSYGSDPNSRTTDLYRGFPIATGLQADPDGTPWCDETKYHIPFTHDFKLSGSTPILYGVDFGFILQNLAGPMSTRTYALVNNQFPGGTSVGTAQTIMLDRPGTFYIPRLVQLDISLKKNFRMGNRSMSFQLDYFNVTNSNSILTESLGVTNADGGGPSLGNVTSFLDGRIPRIAFQYKF